MRLQSLGTTDLLIVGGEAPKEALVAPDNGAVVRRGVCKIAVYRDEAGNHHECSAICPHLGCFVAWNSLEHTWDCPCHGSRFDPYGTVVNGPANRNLTKLQPAREGEPAPA